MGRESMIPEIVLEYAKFVVAAIGVAATTVLGLVPDGSTAKTIATIVAAVATSLLVLIVPNKPQTKS